MLHFAGYGYPAVGKIRIWMHISESNIPTDAKQSKLNYMHDPGLHIWNILFPTFLFWWGGFVYKKNELKVYVSRQLNLSISTKFWWTFCTGVGPSLRVNATNYPVFLFSEVFFLFWPIGKCQNHADILRWHWSWVSQSRGKFKTKSVWGGRRGNTLLLI